MMKKNARFNYLICIYLAGILVFTLFRVAETVVYCSMSSAPDGMASLYGHALWNGFRFDSAVSAYILVLPLLALIVGELVPVGKRCYYAVIHYFIMTLYTVAFFACAADIPFFCYFSQRLDATVMTLGSSLPMVVDMIVSEPSYLAYFFVFLAVAAGWWFLGRLIFRRVLRDNLDRQMPRGWAVAIALLLLFGHFTAIRGHLSSKRPLRPEYAVFCNSPFLNQIGLNPVFTFVKSAEAVSKDRRNPVDLIDLESARQQFALQGQWPLAEGDAVTLPQGTHVVIVLMESMSIEWTALGSRPGGSLTPCLDSLMRHGLTFTEAWSAGTQSDNGIYATHFGHPAIFKRHPMHATVVPRVCGLPQSLRANGYSTAYFMPHKGIFDGMESFFYTNGYDRVFEEGSYPREEIVGTYGVPDHLLFRHAVDYLNKAVKSGPVYATVATCSNHGPYVMPKGIDFRPTTATIEEQMVEYSDWAIGRFMAEAARQPWFDSTLFVFVADHGCADPRPLYDIPLARVRIPITFYAPGRIAPRLVSRPACQIDVSPTILGLLGLDCDHRMLGVDLLRYQRPYALFGTWETLGASDGEFLYIYRKGDGSSSLYRYRRQETDDVSLQYPDRKAALERYAKGIVQLSFQMLTDGTSDCDKQEPTN